MPAAIWVIISLLLAGGAGAFLARFCQLPGPPGRGPGFGDSSQGPKWTGAYRRGTAGPGSQRDDLRSRLEALARSSPPVVKPAIGAMCYAPAPPPDPTDYVCPTCGEKTVHTGLAAILVTREIPEARRVFERIEGLAATLDESQFCAKCSPGTQNPKLVLDIGFDGDAEHQRVENVSVEDLTLLEEFLEGKSMHKGWNGSETPLRDHVARLAELLGVPAPKALSAQQQALRDRLAVLARSPAPTELSMGAMCYKPAAQISRAEYVCPKCGEKTLYTDAHAPFIGQALQECRRLVAALTGVKAELDESQFCRKCSPNATDPKLALVINFEGATEPYTVEGVSLDDIQLLSEFLRGETKHAVGQGREDPLKGHVARLAELLGVAAPTPEELAPPYGSGYGPGFRGASCYAVPFSRSVGEYRCPDCGEATLHPVELSDRLAEVASARRMVAMSGAAAQLDESGFCRNCGDGHDPELALIWHNGEDGERRVAFRSLGELADLVHATPAD